MFLTGTLTTAFVLWHAFACLRANARAGGARRSGPTVTTTTTMMTLAFGRQTHHHGRHTTALDRSVSGRARTIRSPAAGAVDGRIAAAGPGRRRQQQHERHRYGVPEECCRRRRRRERRWWRRRLRRYDGTVRAYYGNNTEERAKNRRKLRNDGFMKRLIRASRIYRWGWGGEGTCISDEKRTLSRTLTPTKRNG